jgi:hypothetical protein
VIHNDNGMQEEIQLGNLTSTSGRPYFTLGADGILHLQISYKTHACCRSSFADGRTCGSCSKARLRKSCASLGISDGISGLAVEEPIFT